MDCERQDRAQSQTVADGVFGDTAGTASQSAELVKATGEPLRALHELENSMRLSGLMEDPDPDTIDLTAGGSHDPEVERMRGKARRRFSCSREIRVYRWL